MNDEKLETYSKTQRATREVVLGRLSLVKLMFLMFMTLAFCMFGPFSVLAPIPLTMALLLYGYVHALSSMAIIIALSLLVGSGVIFGAGRPELNNFFTATGGIFFVASLMATVTAETIRKKLSPVFGYLRGATALFVAVIVILGIAHFASESGLNGVIENQITAIVEESKKNPKFEESLKQDSYISELVKFWTNEPAKAANNILGWLPALLFVGIFMGLWLVHFIVLRNSLVWRQSRYYPYGIRDFIAFRTSDWLIYVLIAGLLFFIIGDKVIGEIAPVIGSNILLGLGVLYFLQGFGVYLEFLRFTRVAGFMRTILVAFTVIFAYHVLVLIGLLDVWFNFRKFFKNKNANND